MHWRHSRQFRSLTYVQAGRAVQSHDATGSTAGFFDSRVLDAFACLVFRLSLVSYKNFVWQSCGCHAKRPGPPAPWQQRRALRQIRFRQVTSSGQRSCAPGRRAVQGGGIRLIGECLSRSELSLIPGSSPTCAATGELVTILVPCQDAQSWLREDFNYLGSCEALDGGKRPARGSPMGHPSSTESSEPPNSGIQGSKFSEHWVGQCKSKHHMGSVARTCSVFFDLHAAVTTSLAPLPFSC